MPNHNAFHLARGRFFWGIGSGDFLGDFEVAGVDPQTGIQRQIAVDAVLDLWGDPRPGAYENHAWTFTVPTPDPRIKKHVWLRPYQQPHPPIAAAGVTEKSETLEAPTQNDSVPTNVVKGSVVPSTQTWRVSGAGSR